MSHMYILDNGSSIGMDGGRYVVKQKDDVIRSIPKEGVESIIVFGNSTITTPCVHDLLERGISVCYFSSKGKYFGRLVSTEFSKVELVKKQFQIFDNRNFSVNLAKNIIQAKIHNQYVVVKRYIKDETEDIKRKLVIIRRMEQKVHKSDSIDEIMGCEGMAARNYFSLLGMSVKPEFRFYGRNRRPPKDAFNSLLSLGYTLLMYDIMAKIESVGLNPYYGFMHTNRDNGPSLVSDLMEEWRAVIVDSIVMSMIQGNELDTDDFVTDDKHEGVYIQNAAIKKFITKFEKKLNTSSKYLAYDDNSYSFRQAIEIQCSKIAECINNNDFERYTPVIIR